MCFDVSCFLIRKFDDYFHRPVSFVSNGKPESSENLKQNLRTIWMFPKIGVPQNAWFIMESPIKMNDLGVPLFLETPIP